MSAAWKIHGLNPDLTVRVYCRKSKSANHAGRREVKIEKLHVFEGLWGYVQKCEKDLDIKEREYLERNYQAFKNEALSKVDYRIIFV